MALKTTGNTPVQPLAYGFIRLYRTLVRLGSPGYQRVTPVADHAPWTSDQAFTDIYRVIKSFTLVDPYRCYEIWSLVEQSAKLEGSLLEVGVWRGGSGALIATKATLCGITNTVYLCDTFRGVVKAHAQKDSSYRGGEHANTSRQIVEDLLQRLHLTNVTILPGVFPEDTGPAIAHERFRFCHIDVDVYQSARDITAWIWDKLVIGGIIVYDDYGLFECDGMRHCVDEQNAMPDRVVLHNLNGQAVIIKIK